MKSYFVRPAGFNPYKSAMKQYFSRTTNQPYKSAEADLIPDEQGFSHILVE